MSAEGVAAYAAGDGVADTASLSQSAKQQDINNSSNSNPSTTAPAAVTNGAGNSSGGVVNLMPTGSKKADASFFSTYFQLESGATDVLESLPTTFHTRIASDSLGDPHLKLA